MLRDFTIFGYALIPQLVLVALLLAVNIHMFSQPMAHRA